MVDLLCCIPGSICCCCNKDRDTAEIHKQDTKPKKIEAEEDGNMASRIMNRFKQYKSPVTAIVVDFYSPLLQNYIVKTVVIVIFSIWFGFTVWGCTRVEDGLDLDDVLPSGTVEHSFASANVRHFAAYSFTIISKDINYTDPEIQGALRNLSEEISKADYVVLAGGLTSYWLNLATRYFTGIQSFYDRAYCARLLSVPLNIQEQVAMQLATPLGDFLRLFTLLHTTIDRLNVNDTTLVSRLVNSCNDSLPPLVEPVVPGAPPENASFYIPSDKFYRYIALWVSGTNMTLCVILECLVL